MNEDNVIDFSPTTIEEIAQAIAAGEMVVVLDDRHRENEGDLIMAAEHAAPAVLRFARCHGPMITTVADLILYRQDGRHRRSLATPTQRAATL